MCFREQGPSERLSSFRNRPGAYGSPPGEAKNTRPLDSSPLPTAWAGVRELHLPRSLQLRRPTALSRIELHELLSTDLMASSASTCKPGGSRELRMPQRSTQEDSVPRDLFLGQSVAPGEHLRTSRNAPASSVLSQHDEALTSTSKRMRQRARELNAKAAPGGRFSRLFRDLSKELSRRRVRSCALTCHVTKQKHDPKAPPRLHVEQPLSPRPPRSRPRTEKTPHLASKRRMSVSPP